MTTRGTCSGPYRYGDNDTNKDIPDDGYGGAWAYSDIFISGAPAASTVTCIDVHYEIIHTYVSDLIVALSDYDVTCLYVLWQYEGGSADNINETETGITECNGKLVNQGWTLWATDDYLGDSGYIDYWWIKVYYDDGEPDLVVERLYVSPSSSTSGTQVTTTVKVTNRGGVAAGAFDVDFYKDRASAPGSGDVGDHTWYVSSLEGGASTTLTWDFNTPGDGSYNAWAYVDRTNAVNESDDIDNNKKGPFLYKVEEPEEVTYYAVICGIADYPGTLPDLDWTDDDATDLNDVLVQYPEWSSANIQLLIDSAATKSEIKAAVDTMRQQADGNDICLFFFSGHGTWGSDIFPFDESDNVDEYLVSCDTGELSDWIRDDEFGEWFEAFPAPVIVLLDTCHSGGQIKGLATGDSTIKCFSMGYPPLAKGDGFAADIQRRFEAKPSGRKDIDDTLTAGGVVVTAADDDEDSWESDPLENGVFTEYVLEALGVNREPADTDDDGDVSAEELYDYVGPRATQYCINDGLTPQHAQLYDNYPPDSPALDDLTVVAPIPGDFEPDGDVDYNDLGFFVSHWLYDDCNDSAGDETDWCDGADLDRDSNVNFSDYAILANNWFVGSEEESYHEDFNDGLPGLEEGWEYYSSDGSGRIEVVNGRLRMDRSPSGTYTLNEAILHLDLAGKSNVVLQFFQAESGDEIHLLPDMFTSHENGDGVSVSNDGATWHQVANANELDVGIEGQIFSVNLDDVGITYTSDFQIKFQQYDNDPWSSDGREFDDVKVTFSGM